ncbi:MAG: transposase [Candidatus Cloacimonetes bacterium]|jgi:putative transposase|nr:transposase [Candidatus Cloacimonadota bacterium]MDD5624386.1 transposase [Candidatus Cloacimonadota bacterium]
MTQPRRKKNEMQELVNFIEELILIDSRSILQKAIDHIMEAEIETKIKVELNKCSKDKVTYKNGYREHKELIKTRISSLVIMVPKIGEGSFYSRILEHYSRVERSLMCIISEVNVSGVSTCKMDKLF